MNIEVEIKVRIDNLAEMREKVEKIGKLVKSIRQVDEYYAPVHRDFYNAKPHPFEFLRIRTNPDKVMLEYCKSVNKRDDGDYDYAEEYETEIKDPEEMRQILERLDFKKALVIDKHREYWLCGDIEIALDEIKDLGSFVEAEAKGDFTDFREAKNACFAMLKNLSIADPEKSEVKRSYPELYMEGLDTKL